MIAAIFFTSVGLGMIAMAIISAVKYRKRVSCWQRSIACFDSVVRENEDWLSCYRFSYTDQQGARRYVCSWTFSPREFHLGDAVEILIGKAENEVQISNWTFLYARYLSPVAWGGILTALGGFMFCHQ